MSIQDFAVEQKPDSTFEIIIDVKNRIYKTTDGLDTAAFYQLFTDKRASRDEIANPLERQGCIIDILTKPDNYELGSLLHLKRQNRNTINDRNDIKTFSVDALNYFVAIGAAKEVSAEAVGDRVEGIIKVEADQSIKYSALWRNTIDNT